jgi:hypothetical protein
MTQSASPVRWATEGGVVGNHPHEPSFGALVAPNTGNHYNSIRLAFAPLACWRADDMRFDFGSSFVLPGITSEISGLKDLIDRHTGTNEKGSVLRPTLSVFGHADPTGNDDFNKVLSGRRAQAIFGMLTRKVALWEDLYRHPWGDDRWDPIAVQKMRDTLGIPEGAEPSDPGGLFKAYMDCLCTIRDENGQPVTDDKGEPVRLKLGPGDFLAGGEDDRGKGDYQGCGEFNPMLMFSRTDHAALAGPERKNDRDEKNAPNRRVVIFLFRPGMHVDPRSWPCPRATEGTAGCRKRFWSDAAKRREFKEKERAYEDTLDTFACRFYDRLSTHSPCNRIVRQFEIRLYDPLGQFMAGAAFRTILEGRSSRPGFADDRGYIRIRDVEVPARCTVLWGPRDTENPAVQPSAYLYRLDVILDIDDSAISDRDGREENAMKRLNNLGYPIGRKPDENIRAFQIDFQRQFGLEVTGLLDRKTMDALEKVHDRCPDSQHGQQPV